MPCFVSFYSFIFCFFFFHFLCGYAYACTLRGNEREIEKKREKRSRVGVSIYELVIPASLAVSCASVMRVFYPFPLLQNISETFVRKTVCIGLLALAGVHSFYERHEWYSLKSLLPGRETCFRGLVLNFHLTS